eukprot:42270_1
MSTKRINHSILSPIPSPQLRFAESVIGHSIIINPAYKDDLNLWDQINWQQTNISSSIQHDKRQECFFATIPFIGSNENDYLCAAVFIDGGGIIYDISPDIIMDRNDWYRSKMIKYVAVRVVAELYLNHWMSIKCGKVCKYKKKMKRLKRNVFKNMVQLDVIMKQYGAYLGYNIFGTLNRNGLRKQQTKMVKMPIMLFKKSNLFHSFVTKNTLYYVKNKKHFFNVNRNKILHEWLITDYVMRDDDSGLWGTVQKQLIYNEISQMLMIKYDVILKDNQGALHFIFRDLNYDNPKYLRYKDIEKLVSGYIRKYSVVFVPVVLVQLCLQYRYMEDGE